MKSIHVHKAVNDAERARCAASEQTSAGVAGTAPSGLEGDTQMHDSFDKAVSTSSGPTGGLTPDAAIGNTAAPTGDVRPSDEDVAALIETLAARIAVRATAESESVAIGRRFANELHEGLKLAAERLWFLSELRNVDPESERAAFEAWYTSGGKWPRAVERQGHGYILLQTQSAWGVWRGARAALNLQVAPLRDHEPGCYLCGRRVGGPCTEAEGCRG